MSVDFSCRKPDYGERAGLGKTEGHVKIRRCFVHFEGGT